MTPAELRALGAQVLLANTYHLFLRPGEAVAQHLGGALWRCDPAGQAQPSRRDAHANCEGHDRNAAGH